MNYKLETSITEIIKQIKVEFPYDNTMCKDKYNESILDYLYEEIVVELTN
jgi:hypothetical protein